MAEREKIFQKTDFGCTPKFFIFGCRLTVKVGKWYHYYELVRVIQHGLDVCNVCYLNTSNNTVKVQCFLGWTK